MTTIDGEGGVVIFTPAGVTKRALTAEEISARAARAEANAQAKTDEAAAAAQKATDKASAKAKLIAGEALTEAEADSILI